eukprot:12518391-Heterocapsa_arctica.AAC.1
MYRDVLVQLPAEEEERASRRTGRIATSSITSSGLTATTLRIRASARDGCEGEVQHPLPDDEDPADDEG